MTVGSEHGPSGPDPSSPERTDAIVAEGLGKAYPRRRITLFPPVVMIHRRGWFTRKGAAANADGSSAEADPLDDAAVRGRTAAALPGGFDLGDELDEEDIEDDDDDDMGEESYPAGPGAPTPERPGELFWRLKDISFSVPPGGALGVLGGPASGKSTLLDILAGYAFPTEGRALVRGRVAPFPSAVAKGLTLSDKGASFKFDLGLAARVAGIPGGAIRRHGDEIEGLAAPILDADGERLPGAFTRLALATAVVLPSDVIFLEADVKGVDEAFMGMIFERVRDRVRGGSSLVLTSRSPEIVGELCDEAIVLSDGSIVDRGPVHTVTQRYEATAAKGKNGKGSSPAVGTEMPTLTGSDLTDRGQLRIPRTLSGFNQVAALLSVTVGDAPGIHSKRVNAASEITVEIRVETAAPDVEAVCGITFTPRGGGTGIRIELPEPLKLIDPGAYSLVARVEPGTLPQGGYEARADAIVSDPSESEASVIVRNAARFRIEGDGSGPTADHLGQPVEQWDGRSSHVVEAEWSAEWSGG